MDKYIKIIDKNEGTVVVVTKSNPNEIILDSSHYGYFSKPKDIKVISEQFKQQLNINRFYKIEVIN